MSLNNTHKPEATNNGAGNNTNALTQENAMVSTNSTVSAGMKGIDQVIFEKAKEILSALKQILEKETTALKSSDIHAAVSCQHEKILLVRQYEALVKEARNNAAILKQSTSGAKEGLIALQNEMQESAGANKRALGNSKKSVERLVNRMMEVIRKSVQSDTQVSYGSTGRVDDGGGRRVAMNIDETL